MTADLSLAVDLSTEPGRAVVRRLVETADVVVENFLPRHLEALGLAVLRGDTTSVWVSVRGAGGDGPVDADAAGGALAGLLSRTPRETGVSCAVVQDLSSPADDPQVVATGLLQEVDHPAGPLRLVGSPFRLDGERPRVRRAPPLLGQHTREVLSALGLSDAQVEEVVGAERR